MWTKQTTMMCAGVVLGLAGMCLAQAGPGRGFGGGRGPGWGLRTGRPALATQPADVSATPAQADRVSPEAACPWGGPRCLVPGGQRFQRGANAAWRNGRGPAWQQGRGPAWQGRRGSGWQGWGDAAWRGRRGAGPCVRAPGAASRGFGRGVWNASSAVCGMSQTEREQIWTLLDHREDIQRSVENLPDGVKTTTTTTRPELVEPLRAHVRQMVSRIEENRPVRLWDPIFADVFDNAEAIQTTVEDIEGGIQVTATSEDADVVPMVQAHAEAVNRFVAKGHTAVRPPWAGGRR